MACFWRCDVCNTEAPAAASGYNRLVPEGWYVVANGKGKTRTFEQVVCSGKCAGKAIEASPDDVGKVSARQVLRQAGS